jgi:TatD DNase family protein
MGRGLCLRFAEMMKTEYIDSHAHLTSSDVYDNVDEMLQRAQEAGITQIVNICTDPETLQRGILLRQKYPFVYNTASTTPHDVEAEGESVFPLIEKHAKNGDLVAIGETGLDYHYQHSPRELQQHFLKRYLHLALECRLPVVIHCREAFDDFFKMIDTEYHGAPGVLHCFTGTVKEAEEVIKRGWYLSLSGIVTFKKSEGLREVAKIVPLEQLFIETDTPYLAPQSRRGKINEPAFLPEIAQCIAEVKGIPVAEVARVTKSNVERLFAL